ncbi:MAG: DMT family transporter [Synergistes sp.]|nr:DMT family transporter [Synergistes sp.]
MNIGSKLIGALCVIAAGMCWGATGTTQALAPKEATSLSIGAARLVFSGALFLAIMMIKTKNKILRGEWNRKGILIAAAGLAGYQLFFFSAVKLTGVAVGTMVTVGCSPAIAGFVGSIAFGERLSIRWYIATALAVTGCAMIVAGGKNAVTFSPLGVILAAASGFSYAMVGVGLRYVKRDAVETAAMMNALSGLMLLPVLLMGDTGWIATAHGSLCVFVLAVVSTIIPYGLFSTGLKYIELGVGYTLSLSEPLMAWFLSVTLLGEHLSLIGTIGVGILFCGLIFLAARK